MASVLRCSPLNRALALTREIGNDGEFKRRQVRQWQLVFKSRNSEITRFQ
ncbi:acetyltransferase [Vibrio parahaemolyticus]|nr:acetyltransferase [Vibrio parahaemolyticus]